jgi:ADP-heptose:LPS heptosyltransferase
MKLPASEIKKIAVFRALQLGDMLCVIPAIRALRAAYPAAEITLLGLPWASSFVERFCMYFDRFIHFPGYPGLPEQSFDENAYNSFLQQMQNEKFDLLLQMQGNGTIVNKIVKDSGAKHLAGFQPEGFYESNPLFISYPDSVHEIKRHLALMRSLDIPLNGLHLEFPLTSDDVDAYNQLCIPVVKNSYVCIHPGSRSPSRQWPPHLFAAFADYFVENNYAVVVTGTADECEITKELLKCAKHRLIDLTGKTNLGAVAMLIKNACMLVSNCTGVSHIAAAFETPSVVISMDGEPERWGPLNKELHTTIDWLKDHNLRDVFLAIGQKLTSSKNLLQIAS